MQLAGQGSAEHHTESCELHHKALAEEAVVSAAGRGGYEQQLMSRCQDTHRPCNSTGSSNEIKHR